MNAECPNCGTLVEAGDESQALDGSLQCKKCSAVFAPLPPGSAPWRTPGVRGRGGDSGFVPNASFPSSRDRPAAGEAAPDPDALAAELFGDAEAFEGEIAPLEDEESLLERAVFDFSTGANQAQKPRPVSSKLNYPLYRSARLQPQVEARSPPPPSLPWAWVAFVQLTAAAMLLVLLVAGAAIYMSNGRLNFAAFSIAALKEQLLSVPEVIATSDSNGIYDTRTGRQVFYVHGTVKQRRPTSKKIRVRAEILDGTQLVRAADGYAGTPYSPEDLYKIDSAEDAEALNSGFGRQPPQAAGERQPFLLTFYEFPPDLSSYQLRVSAFVAEGEQTSKR